MDFSQLLIHRLAAEACLPLELPLKDFRPKPKTGDAAGFDYGNKTFLTSSDTTKYESPEFYK